MSRELSRYASSREGTVSRRLVFPAELRLDLLEQMLTIPKKQCWGFGASQIPKGYPGNPLGMIKHHNPCDVPPTT